MKRLSTKRFLLFPFYVLFLVVASIYLLPGCKSDTGKALPVALKDTIAVNIPISTISIPITYSYDELENFLNGKFRGEFVDAHFDVGKKKKEKVHITLERYGNIQFRNLKGKMVCLIPLRVNGNLEKARLNLENTVKPMTTEVLLELHTPVSLDKNWNLVTKFRLVNHTWKSPPVMQAGPVKFDLTDKLDKLIDQKKQHLADFLDTEINNSVSLAKPVGKIWMDLQKPILVNKKEPLAWIMFDNKSISGNFVLGEEQITCYTSISTQISMVTDTTLAREKKPLPSFKTSKSVSGKSDAWVYAFLAFDELNEKLGDKLGNKTLAAKGMELIIDSIRAYGSDSGLTVMLQTKGTVTAEIIAMGKPSFDSVGQHFRLDNFEFSTSSGNILLNIGESFLHDMLRDTVQTKLSIGLDSAIQKLPFIIENALGKGKTGKTIDLQMGQFKVLSCDVKPDSKKINFLVHVNFDSKMRIKHLNSGKQLQLKTKKKE